MAGRISSVVSKRELLTTRMSLAIVTSLWIQWVVVGLSGCVSSDRRYAMILLAFFIVVFVAPILGGVALGLWVGRDLKRHIDIEARRAVEKTFAKRLLLSTSP